MDGIIERIKGYLKIVNKNIDNIETTNEGLIDYVINVVADRIMLFLLWCILIVNC